MQGDGVARLIALFTVSTTWKLGGRGGGRLADMQLAVSAEASISPAMTACQSCVRRSLWSLMINLRSPSIKPRLLFARYLFSEANKDPARLLTAPKIYWRCAGFQ